MRFRRGMKVEYAAHGVSWQAGHNETDVHWHLADGREPISAPITDEHAEALNRTLREMGQPEIGPEPEDWRPATVVAVTEHPLAPHLNKHEPDVVVTLQPDDGQPPFDLNAKLVRGRAGRKR